MTHRIEIVSGAADEVEPFDLYAVLDGERVVFVTLDIVQAEAWMADRQPRPWVLRPQGRYLATDVSPYIWHDCRMIVDAVGEVASIRCPSERTATQLAERLASGLYVFRPEQDR